MSTTIDRSSNWDATDLSHRFTVSFFAQQYNEDPAFISATKDRKNSELLYLNIAGSNNITNATICAGLLVNYMEAQGIPYHAGKSRPGCLNKLRDHLKRGAGKVLFTADIVDHWFRFLGE